MMSDYDTFLLDIFAVFTDGTTAYKNINAAQSSVSYDKISTLDIHFLSYEPKICHDTKMFSSYLLF